MSEQTNKGFTIIEALIVLAIAGSIIALVLMVFPILSRNSRNSQRKQDVASILNAVAQYELNNSAEFPTDPVTTLKSAKLTAYVPSSGQIKFTAQVSGSATNQSPHSGTYNGHTVTEWVNVVNYARCKDDDSGGTTAQGADYTDIVALYAIESSGSSTPKCSQL